MAEIETAALPDRAAGRYSGTNLLWFEDPDRPEESAAEVHVDADRIRYSWSFRGEPQSGVFPFVFEGNAVSVDWTDTWHSTQPMTCTGTRTADAITFQGTYPAGDGPDWGWRTEIRQPAPDRVLIEMYNIEPSGEEQIAVRIQAQRR